MLGSCLACVQGFDEYMNLVLDEAEEVSMKRKTRKPVGACQPTHSGTPYECLRVIVAQSEPQDCMQQYCPAIDSSIRHRCTNYWDWHQTGVFSHHFESISLCSFDSSLAKTSTLHTLGL